jgi:hypothetical protein
VIRVFRTSGLGASSRRPASGEEDQQRPVWRLSPATVVGGSGSKRQDLLWYVDLRVTEDPRDYRSDFLSVCGCANRRRSSDIGSGRSQRQRWSGRISDMTSSMCWPHPRQVVFPQRAQRAGEHMLVSLDMGERRSSGTGGVGSIFSHGVSGCGSAPARGRRTYPLTIQSSRVGHAALTIRSQRAAADRGQLHHDLPAVTVGVDHLQQHSKLTSRV